MKIGLVSRHASNLWLRQTARGNGCANGAQFLIDQSENIDALAVFDEPAKGQTTTVPRANRILITGEPRAIKRYSISYLNQFGTVISPYRHWGYRGRLVQSQTGLPWFYGLSFDPGGIRSALDFAQIEALEPQPRTLAVSAVISTKTKTALHRRRLAFVEQLHNRIGNQLLLFGNGFQPLADKADAINACRYHLVLENSADPHYWSEKLADAYLGWALPIFSGTQSIGSYFPAGAFETIDTNQPDVAVAQVVRLLQDDPWPQRLPHLREARRRVMYEYNFLAMVADAATEVVKGQPTPALNAPVPLLSSGAATPRGRLSRMLGLR